MPADARGKNINAESVIEPARGNFGCRANRTWRKSAFGAARTALGLYGAAPCERLFYYVRKGLCPPERKRIP